MRLAAIACAVVMVVFGPSVYAQDLSWPMVRHDTQRTNRAAGEGRVTHPAVKARIPAGSTVGARALRWYDVDGDGRSEVLLVDAGRIICRDLEDRLRWDTPNLGLVEIFGLIDFNGDGRPEILGLGDQGLVLLDPQAGALLWRKSDFAQGNNRTHDRNTKVGDLDGDGLPEIVVKAHSASDGLIHAYTFKGGFPTDPEAASLWAYPVQGYKGNLYPVGGDVDGDGEIEIVSVGLNDYEVVDGRTGSPEIYVSNLEMRQSSGPTYVVQLDDDGQEEVVHFVREEGKGMGLMVLDVAREPAGPAATLSWDPSVNDVEVPYAPFCDVDGDGRPEIVLDRWDGSRWSVWVLRYVEAEGSPFEATLELVATLPDASARAVADLDGDGLGEIIVEDTLPGLRARPALSTVRVMGVEGGLFTDRWSRPNSRVQTGWKELPLEVNTFLSIPPLLTLDLDLDGHPEILLEEDLDGDLSADLLWVVTPSGDEAARLSYDPLPSQPLAVATGLQGLGDAVSILLLHDDHLRVADTGLALLPPTISAAAAEPDVFAPDLDQDGQAEIVFQAGSGALVAWSLDGPPHRRWSYPDAAPQAPTFLDLGQGTLSTVVVNPLEPGATTLNLLDADGTLAGVLRVPADLESQPTAVDVDQDNIQELFFPYVAGVEAHAAQLLDLAAETTRWDAPLPGESYAPLPHTTFVVPTDTSSSDICLVLAKGWLGCMAGDTGQRTGLAVTGTNNGAAMVATLLEGPDLALVNHATVASWSTGLSLRWSINRGAGEASAWKTNTFILKGAVGDVTGDGLDEIFAAAADNRLYRFGPDGGTGFIRYLSGGEVSADPAAYDASTGLGRSALGDIDGDGALEIVVGGADGWLYSISASTGGREWALVLPQRVGDPILADVDGDGGLEIVVGVGDGQIYVIDEASLSASAEVRDVPRLAGGQPDIESPDIDAVEGTDGLAASWAAVPGAAGYNVAVETGNGSNASGWIDVGPATSASFELPLAYGHTYFVVVTAYDDAGEAGVAARSDGVSVVDLTPPRVEGVQADPDPFDPNRETTQLTARLTDTTALSMWSLEIFDGDQRVWARGDAVGTTSLDLDLTWDGHFDEGTSAPDGFYTVLVSARDQAGHSGSATGHVEVRRRPDPTPSLTPAPGTEPLTPQMYSPTPTTAWASQTVPPPTPSTEGSATPAGPTATPTSSTSGTDVPTATPEPTSAETSPAPSEPATSPGGQDTPAPSTTTPTARLDNTPPAWEGDGTPGNPNIDGCGCDTNTSERTSAAVLAGVLVAWRRRRAPARPRQQRLLETAPSRR